MEMKPAIQIDRLSYAYPDGTRALVDASFSIAAGECVALLGANGSGKSTLLQHLNGILPEKFRAPQVFIHGEAVVKENLDRVRSQVGLLFQDPDDQLFCASVAEDVAFAPQQMGLAAKTVRERVAAALARVGLPHHGPRAPHHLSQGEKRRVCLAGLLAYEPSILVLDEPSSGLDPRGRRELMSLLWALSCTRLVASHDLEMVVELCPRSIILDHGHIVADGPTTELLSNETLMIEHRLEVPHILQHRHPHHEIVWNPQEPNRS
jgi:cobalt/nickel transport system ATP-binding protein